MRFLHNPIVLFETQLVRIGRDIDLEQSVALASSLRGCTETNYSEHRVGFGQFFVVVKLDDWELGGIHRAVKSQEHEVKNVQRRVIFGMLALLCDTAGDPP